MQPKDLLEAIEALQMQDVLDFHEYHVRGEGAHIMVIGPGRKLDFDALAAYGAIRVLSRRKLFGI